ncbi:MAG: hypothetical protein EHM12_08720 [Dehalococcoidia bacterium]|nr:MAG: hypothetical protein EHM12_08720 [Dehalococcoidia bacterium]
MNEKARRPNRVFTPEQKYEILKDIEKYRTIREGLQKHQISPSVYHRWKRQLTVGVNASLRNSKPLKSFDVRKLEEENRKLKEVVLNQSLMITSLKKEMSLD